MINRSKFLSFFVLITAVALLTTGCEPLRKKFTRKKKEANRAEEFIPVLQPEEYAAPKFDPVVAYKHRYNLWRTWYDDFMQGLDEDGSSKRQQYVLGQMVAQCEEMSKLLSGDSQAQVKDVLIKLKDVMQMLDSPVPMRNEATVKNKLSAINSQIRDNLKPEKVEAFLSTPL